MTELQHANPDNSLYRVDSFIVPATAREDFLERLFIIRDFLATQPGCRYNRVAEELLPDGNWRMLTVVEWEDAEAMAGAKQNAGRHYQTTGFNPQEFMQRLGVVPDFGIYQDRTASQSRR